MDLVAQVDTAARAIPLELDLGLPPKIVARRPRRRGAASEALHLVADFHFAFNLPIQTRPQYSADLTVGSLRVELLREELEEFKDAVEREDLVAIADALADIVYVAYGSAITYGIDLDAVLREVHRANMSKLNSNGQPIMREDGKVLKPPTYSPPDVQRVLLDQPPLFLD